MRKALVAKKLINLYKAVAGFNKASGDGSLNNNMERPLYCTRRDRLHSGRANRMQLPRDVAHRYDCPPGQADDRLRANRCGEKEQSRPDALPRHRHSEKRHRPRPPSDGPTHPPYQLPSSTACRPDGCFEDCLRSHQFGCLGSSDHPEDRTSMQPSMPDTYKSTEEYDYHRFEQEDGFQEPPSHSRVEHSHHERWIRSDHRSKRNKNGYNSHRSDQAAASHRRANRRAVQCPLPSTHGYDARPTARHHPQFDASQWQPDGSDGCSLYPPHSYWPEEASRPQAFDDCYCDDQGHENGPQQWSTSPSFEWLANLPGSFQSVEDYSEATASSRDRRNWRQFEQLPQNHSAPSLEELPQHRGRRLPRNGRATQESLPGDTGHFQQFSSSYVDPSGNRVETFLTRNSEGRTAENSRTVRSPIIQIPYDSLLANTTTRQQAPADMQHQGNADPNLSQIRQFVHRVLDSAILPMASNSLYRTLQLSSARKSTLPLNLCAKQRS